MATVGRASFLPPGGLRTTSQPIGGNFWGDLVGIFNGMKSTPGQGVVNVDDVFAVIKTWQQADGTTA